MRVTEVSVTMGEGHYYPPMLMKIEHLVEHRAIGISKAERVCTGEVCFWPKPAVELSKSGRQGGIIADCHEGPEPTYCVEKLLGKSGLDEVTVQESQVA